MASVSCPARSRAGKSGLMARLWSNRMPAEIVRRSLIVIASLANAPAVMNSPPGVAGSRDTA